MKKFKFLLSGVSILSIVGSAMAFSSSKLAQRVVYYNTVPSVECPSYLISATKTETDEFVANLYATTNANGDCLSLGPVYAIEND